MTFSQKKEIERAAERWLAREDRGLSAVERAEFERWLKSPAHARAFEDLAGPFRALDRAARLRPHERHFPDPDLLLKRPPSSPMLSDAPPRERTTRSHRGWMSVGVAAAVVLGGLFFSLRSPLPDRLGERGVVVRHMPERLTLPDGSTVESRRGTVLETAFSAQERRVYLRSGEAYFEVKKDATRPFIVAADKVAVQAVGTAFVVSATMAEVEVVVTEGRVRVEDIQGKTLLNSERPAAVVSAFEAATSTPIAKPGLDAGQRVVIATQVSDLAPGSVQVVTPAEIDRATAWRKVWLEFGEMRLAHVVDEFNRVTREQGGRELRIADEETGRIMVSGTFRADEVDAFVRVLQTTFGVGADEKAQGVTTLRKGL